MLSWLEKLDQTRAEHAERDADPWQRPLLRLRGTVGRDGLEYISSQQVYDFLQLSQRGRGSGTSRRVAAVMASLGWSAARLYAPNGRGFREQVRGFYRDTRQTALSAS